MVKVYKNDLYYGKIQASKSEYNLQPIYIQSQMKQMIVTAITLLLYKKYEIKDRLPQMLKQKLETIK